MITLLQGEDATLLCSETETTTFPYLEDLVNLYDYQALLAFYSVQKIIPGLDSISIQGVFLTGSQEFIPATIWVLTEKHSGYLPTETARQILQEAGFPAAIPPASPSVQKTDPDQHRQNPQTTHAASPQPAPLLPA